MRAALGARELVHRDAIEAFEDRGYACLPGIVPAEECASLAEVLPACVTAGTRRMLDLPAIRSVACRLREAPSIAALLPERAEAVQCTLFSKGLDANWLVSPHQDLSIPVAGRVSSPQCRGWSEKEACWFVQPPVRVLETLIAVRLHLDPPSEQSAQLHVVSGSHLAGRLSGESMAKLTAQRPLHACVVPQGGVLAMRPLLVHASGKSASGAPRRVLHFLFGPAELPFGLAWATTA